jgi:hypothetical protein
MSQSKEKPSYNYSQQKEKYETHWTALWVASDRLSKLQIPSFGV